MIARGFKPVGWVAGVAAAALSCYMLSLNVAAERAELAKLEWRIVMTKRDIRTLQTELGTRGRLQQLESWNANILALSAPTSAQYLDSEVTLARFDQREKTIEERSVVQMASAEDAAPPAAPQPKIEAPVRFAAAPAAEQRPLVHQASLVVEPKPLAPRKAAEEKKVEPKAPAKQAEAKAPAKQVEAKKEVSEPKPQAAKKPAEKVAAATPASTKKPADKAAAKPAAKIDGKLAKTVGDAAKAEKKGSAGGQ